MKPIISTKMSPEKCADSCDLDIKNKRSRWLFQWWTMLKIPTFEDSLSVWNIVIFLNRSWFDLALNAGMWGWCHFKFNPKWLWKEDSHICDNRIDQSITYCLQTKVTRYAGIQKAALRKNYHKNAQELFSENVRSLWNTNVHNWFWQLNERAKK